MNIFITGGTGFLGSYIVREYLNAKNRVFVMVRARGSKDAAERVKSIVDEICPKAMRKDIYKQIRIIRGDVTKPGLGITRKDFVKLQKVIDIIYHCAVVRSFYSDPRVMKKANIDGTENLLKVALCWHKNGCLKKVNHISTVYIAGNYHGKFYEDQRDVSQDFNNQYEKTKFFAEKLVLKYREKALPVDIYRPSIIAESGSTRGGAISLLLKLMPLFRLEILDKIPMDDDTELNIIPVQSVATAIYLISNTKGRPINQTYHIVNPRPVKLGSIISEASKVFGFKKPKCIPAGRFNMDELSFAQRQLITVFIPYFNNRGLSFDMCNAHSVLKRYDFKVPSINRDRLRKMFASYKSGAVV